jgi:hypothetical protein
MMTEPKISTILHRAADKYLTATMDNWSPHGKTEEFSCNSIRYACHRHYKLKDPWWFSFENEDDNCVKQLWRRIEIGLVNMGLSTESARQFDEFCWRNSDGEGASARQGARYSWLKFCAMVAEEQGL